VGLAVSLGSRNKEIWGVEKQCVSPQASIVWNGRDPIVLGLIPLLSHTPGL